MLRRFSLLLVVVSLLPSSRIYGDDSWTGWRGAKRDGKSTATGLTQSWEDNEPELVWMSEGMGKGYASVSISKGKLYTTGNFGDGQAVVAVELADGSAIWKTRITESDPKHGFGGSRTTPALDGDRLYVVASSGKIACLKTDSGEIVWERDFKTEWNGKMMSVWGFSESPLVDGDHVLCTPGGPQAMMVCLNKMTGEEIWKSAVPELGNAGKDGAGYSSIVISAGGGVKQYVQLIGRGVIGVRASDGKFLWGYNDIANSTANIPTPVPTGDFVFCSTGYGTGAALLELVPDGEGGVNVEERYFLKATKLQNHHGGMILVDGKIYCGHNHNKGFPICVDMESGKTVWGGKQRGPGKGSAAITYADGNLVFRYQDGLVALIEATSEAYRLKGTFRPAFQQGNSWAHPVVVGKRLYLREQDKLMCYDIGA